MKKTISIFAALISAFCGALSAGQGAALAPVEKAQQVPTFLYKIIYPGQWAASQTSDRVSLGPEDKEFIHLAMEQQLSALVKKQWILKHFILLQLATELIPGRFVLETNPGGKDKYYHLYDGYLPLDAITDVVEVQPDGTYKHIDW
jgi:uncharacterized protein (DUF952 family)